MSTISHPPTGTIPERGWITVLLRAREMWASLGIFAMWIAVAVASIWGPNAVFQSNDGNGSTIPTGIFVALFASIGTWAVAKYALGRAREK
jgi:hypothetical protein